MTMLLKAKPLLDFIGKYESGGDYNIVWGGIKQKDRPIAPLTSMTIRQVLAWQDSIDPYYMSEAAGKYQIMEDTLREIYAPAGMILENLFNDNTQDRLALYLLKRRGLRKYLSGEISAEQFANNVAKEWASMPVVSGSKRGRSFYDGDGLNSTHVSVDSYLSVINALRTVDNSEPAKKKGWLDWMGCK